MESEPKHEHRTELKTADGTPSEHLGRTKLRISWLSGSDLPEGTTWSVKPRSNAMSCQINRMTLCYRKPQYVATSFETPPLRPLTTRQSYYKYCNAYRVQPPL
jgi:hypothetical protein